MRTGLYTFLIFLPALAIGPSCTPSEEPKRRESEPVNYRPFSGDKIEVNYAEGFRITYSSGYKRLDILNPHQDRTDTLHYLLVSRGSPPPKVGAETQVIEIPVRSMIATSTTHLALTDMLDANDIIKGITQPEYVYSKEIRMGLEKGTVTPFSGGEFNREQALAISPDLIMISGGQASQIDNYRVLMESGIDVIVNSEWLENTPLGKAEWVKVMALLLEKEKLANRRFSRIEERYLELKERASRAADRPLVINNMPYKGAWFVSGGESFTAQYLKDAGADYPWLDTESTGGLRMGFEAVYEVGLRANIWINPGNAGSLEEIAATDSRFRDFESYQTGEIYNNNRRLSPSGGNDFWESGVVHPEIVLADLIRIFHPNLLPNHQLYYYQKLD